MKKIVQLSESQFKSLIEEVINESPEDLRLQHWENKFQRSIEMLLSLGYKPDDLKKKIDKFLLNKGSDISN